MINTKLLLPIVVLITFNHQCNKDIQNQHSYITTAKYGEASLVCPLNTNDFMSKLEAIQTQNTDTKVSNTIESSYKEKQFSESEQDKTLKNLKASIAKYDEKLKADAIKAGKLKAEQLKARNESEITTAVRNKDLNGMRIPVKDYELNEMCKMVMAEAGDQGVHGQRLVADVIINRVTSKQFPNNIHDVLFQKGQFQPIDDKRYWNAKPTKETIEAVSIALTTTDESGGALYFMQPEISTKSGREYIETRQFIARYKDHEFYR